MKFGPALLAASLLALPAAAFAQPVDGFYVGAGFGFNGVQDQTIDSVQSGGVTLATPGAKGHTNGGPMVSVSAGYGYGNGFRLELQADYRNYHQQLAGSVAGIAVASLPGLGGSALNETYGGFVNGYLDFDVGVPHVYPYVGLGAGYERTSLSIPLKTVSNCSPALQGMLGVAFPVPAVAGLSFTAEYRMMATLLEERFSSNGQSAKVAQQYNHAAVIGLRYVFQHQGAEQDAPIAQPVADDAPAPPPKPVPAAPAARTYLVFFDWNRADLTAAARNIIADAARAAASLKVTRIEVSGHTDRSGASGYNQTLSQARANAVAAELQRLGVRQDEIVIQGFGASQPAVAGAGQEAQNRRVEIVLK